VAFNVINTGTSAAAITVDVAGFVPANATGWLTESKNDFTRTVCRLQAMEVLVQVYLQE
jgi:hypothetical protein